MDWINGLFSIPSALQAVVVISLICTIGLGLGKIKVAGISLGIAFVFFFGIAVGSFGLEVDAQMLNYCETFGLVIFVYTLGLHVGPTVFGCHFGRYTHVHCIDLCHENSYVRYGWNPLWSHY